MSRTYYGLSSAGTCNPLTSPGISKATDQTGPAAANTVTCNSSDSNAARENLDIAPVKAGWAADSNFQITVEVTTANMNLSLEGFQVDRYSSGCFAQSTLVTTSGLGRNLGTTGSVTHTVNLPAEATASATDRMEVKLKLSNGAMSSQTVGLKVTVQTVAFDSSSTPVTCSGAATPEGALVKRTNKVLAGAGTPAGSLVKQVTKVLAGAVSSIVGALVKQVNKVLNPWNNFFTYGGRLDLTNYIAAANGGASGGYTVSAAQAQNDPDGVASTGDKLVETVATTFHFIRKQTAYAPASGVKVIYTHIFLDNHVDRRYRHYLIRDPNGDWLNGGFSAVVIDTQSRTVLYQHSDVAFVSIGLYGSANTFLRVDIGCTVLTGSAGFNFWRVEEYEHPTQTSETGSLSYLGDSAKGYFSWHRQLTIGAPAFVKPSLIATDGSALPSNQMAVLVPVGSLTKSKTFAVTASGAVTSIVGALVKRVNLNPAGAISSIVGSLVKQTNKSASGSVSSSGTNVKQVNKIIGGGATPAGSLTAVRQVLKSLSGAITSIVGTVVKQVNKNASGSVSSSGAAVKQVNKNVSGAATPGGSLVKQAQKILSGAVTSIVGTLVKRTNKNAAGSVASSGALTKQTNKTTTGSVTPAGVNVKQVNKILSGTVTSAGVLARTVVRLVSAVGAVTPSGALVKRINKLLTGSVASAGTTVKQVNKSASGSVASAGTDVKRVNKGASGSVGSGGSLSNQVNKNLVGAMTPSGGLVKRINKILSGLVSSIGSLIREIIGGAGERSALEGWVYISPMLSGMVLMGPMLTGEASAQAMMLSSSVGVTCEDDIQLDGEVIGPAPMLEGRVVIAPALIGHVRIYPLHYPIH